MGLGVAGDVCCGDEMAKGFWTEPALRPVVQTPRRLGRFEIRTPSVEDSLQHDVHFRVLEESEPGRGVQRAPEDGEDGTTRPADQVAV